MSVYGFVYLIENSMNDKLYIGQSINPNVRRKAHFAFSKKCGNSALKSAMRKYGRENFDFVLLETCSSQEELNEREIYWIYELNAVSPNGYNLTHGGDSYVPSEETRRKMSAWQKGKKILTEEHKKKISLAGKGKSKSAAARITMSLHSPYRDRAECVNGHPLEGDNLLIHTRKDGRTYRKCRTCALVAGRKSYHKRKAEHLAEHADG